MAIGKSEATGLGVNANAAYHRISNLRGDPSDPRGLRVEVSSYYNQAARSGRSKAYRTRWFLLKPALSGNNTNLLDDLYTKLKNESEQHEGFFNSGTTDV